MLKILFKGTYVLIAAMMLLGGISGVLLGLSEGVKPQNIGDAVALFYIFLIVGPSLALMWAGYVILKGLLSKGASEERLPPESLTTSDSMLESEQLSADNKFIPDNDVTKNKGRFILLLIMAAFIGINIILVVLRSFL